MMSVSETLPVRQHGRCAPPIQDFGEPQVRGMAREPVSVGAPGPRHLACQGRPGRPSRERALSQASMSSRLCHVQSLIARFRPPCSGYSHLSSCRQGRKSAGQHERAKDRQAGRAFPHPSGPCSAITAANFGQKTRARHDFGIEIAACQSRCHFPDPDTLRSLAQRAKGYFSPPGRLAFAGADFAVKISGKERMGRLAQRKLRPQCKMEEICNIRNPIFLLLTLSICCIKLQCLTHWRQLQKTFWQFAAC